MKTVSSLFAILAALILFTSGLLKAQDGQYAPPPPPGPNDQQGMGAPQDQGPPPPDQGAPQDQGAPPPDQGGDQGASFQTFYDQLGSQGTWVQTDNYGYAFQPNVTDPQWAPYTDGHWVYADVGWTWVSDEPWGWATYHYGRWINIDGTGWVWVPGYRWAPAWVSWRYGGGYCGWAPLPPETFIGAEYAAPGVAIGIGFHFGGDVDVNFNIGPGCYTFLPVGYMGARNYHGYYLDRSRNFTVINHTTNITNININHGHFDGAARFRGVAVGGPPINEINAHSQQHVENVRLEEARQPGRANLQGNSLAVYAPHVNAATARQSRPTQVGRTISNPTFNRGDSITKPLDVTSTVRPNAPSQQAIREAQAARASAPAHARIATENTAPKTFNQPLTSMQPVTQTSRTQGAVNAGANSIRPSTEHSPASAPLTGEPVQHHTTTPGVNPAYTGQPNHPATTTIQPNAVHPSGTSPYTGEAVTPQVQHHPQTESIAPTQTYHPQTQQAAPSQTYHPQSQSVAPAQTYHPQTEQVAPAETHHHTESQQSAPAQNHAPAQSFHPQSQGAPQAQPHAQAAPQKQAAPANGGGGDNKGNGH